MTVLCYIDTETTGLDPRIHQPYEVCWWREDESEPTTARLDHTLEYADRKALDIGHYFERGLARDRTSGWTASASDQAGYLTEVLWGVTLVGSNPSFDAAMLTRFIGAPVWHHRLIDVSNVAMGVFNLDRPIGLADVVARCRDRGFEIPEPDHTAEGDVRATKAVYEAMWSLRSVLHESPSLRANRTFVPDIPERDS
jgi:hypothetical protein